MGLLAGDSDAVAAGLCYSYYECYLFFAGLVLVLWYVFFLVLKSPRRGGISWILYINHFSLKFSPYITSIASQPKAHNVITKSLHNDIVSFCF